MGSLFSSPSKSASQAASATQGINQADIQQAENYTNKAATNTQNAIANSGANPYFGAAALMNPSAYAVNPNDTVTFGQNGPPGTSTGSGFNFSNPLPSSSLNQPSSTPPSPGAGTQTQAQSPGLSNAQYLQSAGMQPSTSAQGSPSKLSNGKQNTAEILSVL